MINQGDSLKFTGYLEKLVNGVWQRVTNISGYTIYALVNCKATRKSLLYSTGDSTYNISNNGTNFSFTMSRYASASMVGDCEIEISYMKDGNAVIADNMGKFIIRNSILGRKL